MVCGSRRWATIHTRIDGHHLPHPLPAHALLLAARTRPLCLHLQAVPTQRPRHTYPTTPHADTTAVRVSHTTDHFHGQDEGVGLSTCAKAESADEGTAQSEETGDVCAHSCSRSCSGGERRCRRRRRGGGRRGGSTRGARAPPLAVAITASPLGYIDACTRSRAPARVGLRLPESDRVLYLRFHDYCAAYTSDADYADYADDALDTTRQLSLSQNQIRSGPRVPSSATNIAPDPPQTGPPRAGTLPHALSKHNRALPTLTLLPALLLPPTGRTPRLKPQRPAAALRYGRGRGGPIRHARKRVLRRAWPRRRIRLVGVGLGARFLAAPPWC